MCLFIVLVIYGLVAEMKIYYYYNAPILTLRSAVAKEVRNIGLKHFSILVLIVCWRMILDFRMSISLIIFVRLLRVRLN